MIGRKKQWQYCAEHTAEAFKIWELMILKLDYFELALQPPAPDRTKFDAPKLSNDCLTKIMMHLVDKKQLSKTDAELWLYWFNRNPLFDNPKQLKWIGSPTMLANVMSQICGNYQKSVAKNAFEPTSHTAPTMSKYKNTKMYRTINQIMTISK
jgi:hypothetical protein